MAVCTFYKYTFACLALYRFVTYVLIKLKRANSMSQPRIRFVLYFWVIFFFASFV